MQMATWSDPQINVDRLVDTTGTVLRIKLCLSLRNERSTEKVKYILYVILLPLHNYFQTFNLHDLSAIAHCS